MTLPLRPQYTGICYRLRLFHEIERMNGNHRVP